MHVFATSLLIAILTCLTTGNEILFSEKRVKIIAQRDIQPLITTIQASRNTFAIQHAKSLLKPKSNKLLKQCSNSANHELRNAYKKIEYIFNQPSRVKRGLDFLGEALSAITGVPSPTDFKHLNILLTDLQHVSNDELNDIKDLHNLEQVDHQIAMKNLHLINGVLAREQQAEKIIQHDEQNLILCDSMNQIVQDAKSEIDIITEIDNKATNFIPSRNMFPPKRIQKAISNLASSDKILRPFFLTGNKVEEFYRLKSTVTTIHNNKILSIALIPMINPAKSLSTQSLTMQQKINDNILLIETIAKTKITHIAMDTNERFFNLISNPDLDNCDKLQNKNTYICDHRFIEIKSNQLHKSNPCLAYEVEPDTFVFTCETTFTKKCHDSQTTDHAANFSLISLPASCSLDSDSVYVHRHPDPKTIKITTKFEIVDIPAKLRQTSTYDDNPATTSTTDSSLADEYNDYHNKLVQSLNQTIADSQKVQKDMLDSHHTYFHVGIGLTASLILVTLVISILICRKHKNCFSCNPLYLFR